MLSLGVGCLLRRVPAGGAVVPDAVGQWLYRLGGIIIKVLRVPSVQTLLYMFLTLHAARARRAPWQRRFRLQAPPHRHRTPSSAIPLLLQYTSLPEHHPTMLGRRSPLSTVSRSTCQQPQPLLVCSSPLPHVGVGVTPRTYCGLWYRRPHRLCPAAHTSVRASGAASAPSSSHSQRRQRRGARPRSG